MVFYYTSGNVKMYRNILKNFESKQDMTPLEYVKEYVDNCPDDMEESRIKWITDTFLRIQKHYRFLQQIAEHLSNVLSEEEQDYFVIILQAIIFELKTKHTDALYKTLFNLSKPLLNTFTVFLSDNEVLAYVSDVAQNYFDAVYITEKIIAPLFNWQPYLSELAHRYAEFIHTIESRKVRHIIPTTPNVLTRKVKYRPHAASSQPSIPIAPQNSLHKNRKMLTKSAIDRKLKIIHQQNKQNATNLLMSVKDNNPHYAQAKNTDHHCTKMTFMSDEKEVAPFPKPKKIVAKSSLPPVRDNKVTINRYNHIVKRNEQEEVDWLQDLVSCCRNYKQVEVLLQKEREENEKGRLYDIEKKHLMGQLSYEEAILAKEKVKEENKKKHARILKEKEQWEKEIEDCRRQYIRKSHLNFKECAMLELRINEARQACFDKNKEKATQIKIESEKQRAEIQKARQEELETKLAMIREIKALHMVAKKSKLPKIIDLTEQSGVGLLCEMSIAELQERLAALKMNIKEEIERRRNAIQQNNEAAKKALNDMKLSAKEYFDERSELREKAKSKKKIPVKLDRECKNEIDILKKMLEEKRNMRIKTLAQF